MKKTEGDGKQRKSSEPVRYGADARPFVLIMSLHTEKL